MDVCAGSLSQRLRKPQGGDSGWLRRDVGSNAHCKARSSTASFLPLCVSGHEGSGHGGRVKRGSTGRYTRAQAPISGTNLADSRAGVSEKGGGRWVPNLRGREGGKGGKNVPGRSIFGVCI